MSDFTRWLMILAARIEVYWAWKRARHYQLRYEVVSELAYLTNPNNNFGFWPLSWLFLKRDKVSLLSRIKDELVRLPLDGCPKDQLRRLRVRAADKGTGWRVSRP